MLTIHLLCDAAIACRLVIIIIISVPHFIKNGYQRNTVWLFAVHVMDLTNIFECCFGALLAKIALAHGGLNEG
jgi:hypothetical protein